MPVRKGRPPHTGPLASCTHAVLQPPLRAGAAAAQRARCCAAGQQAGGGRWQAARTLEHFLQQLQQRGVLNVLSHLVLKREKETDRQVLSG